MSAYRRRKSWLKHWDFIVIDFIILIVSYLIANYIRFEQYNGDIIFHNESIILVFALLCTILFTEPYKNILKNSNIDELVRISKQSLLMFIINVMILYVSQMGNSSSRFILVIAFIIYIILDLIARTLRKYRLRKKLSHYGSNRAMIVLSDSKHIQNTIHNLITKSYKGYTIMAAFLLDYDGRIKKASGVPVLGSKDDMLKYASHNWVDSVTINLSNDQLITELKDTFEMMGITTHTILAQVSPNDNEYIHKLGNFIVSSNSYRSLPLSQTLCKRLMDIVGGFVGCVFTLILMIFIGPAIYIKSPGPIFFAQTRVGKNGKLFKMYKFRSMYMDAEERKKELMEKNKINGLMFKIDDDPRIIGSEKKDKNGKPKGIGNFIRNTSIDEFPQFFNVLKGDMSLVGTRPPTVDEWEQYSPHHRKRMSIRPGITGLWQISGRSNITDFEEVVRLDSEYIDTWTNALDIRIILKTISSVIRHEGAE